MRRKRRLTQDAGDVVSGNTGKGCGGFRDASRPRTSANQNVASSIPLENAEDASHILITGESIAAERKADSEQNLQNLRCARSLCNE